jgi:hypothetical protein
LLKNNIQFFENYLKLLKGDKDLNDIKIEDFVKMIPKEQKKINDFNNANNKSYSQVKKKDIIEENIKALGIGDWGLGIGDWAQSPIPNPQSPIPMFKVCHILIMYFKIKFLIFNKNNKK